MHYGAISTDIKKSSSNWGTFPKWMESAVTLTNNITEYVFNTYKIIGEDATQMILPQSPEGDAYTLFYAHENKSTLEKHMADVALRIQSILAIVRKGKPTDAPSDVIFGGYGMTSEDIRSELKDMLKDMIRIEGDAQNTSHEKVHSLIDIYKGIDDEYDYIGRIYLRIGIAMDSKLPFEYKYNNVTSYRGGVIDFSELAEQNAPYKAGYGIYNHDTKKVDVVETTSVAFKIDWSQIARDTEPAKQVQGFMVFVHYHFGITDEMVEKDPHLIVQKKEEFKTLHDETNKRLRAIEGVRLVKVKRDSSSMYCIKSRNATHRAKVQLFTVCSEIVSLLPKGSSVGICYSGNSLGKLNEVKRGSSQNVDYFGETVNMAARMEFTDWSYTTADGITVNDKHENRVAYADWKDVFNMYAPASKKNRENSEAEVVKYPFKLDKIPLESLNAGYGEYVYVLSKKLHGQSKLKVGDRVRYAYGRGYTGVIEKIDIFQAVIKFDTTENSRVVKVRLLEKIQGGDTANEISKFLTATSIALYKLKF